MSEKILEKRKGEKKKVDEIEVKKEKVVKKKESTVAERTEKVEELKVEPSRPSGITKEELTEEEKKVLAFLEIVNKNKNGLRITGFQIKDFLASIFPEIDIDRVYSQLKEKNFVSPQKDSEEFWLTYKGEEESPKYEEFKKYILEKIGSILESSLEEDSLLKRILYLSYLDEWKFKAHYLPKIKDNLSEKHQILCTFICDKKFLQLPSVEKLVRRVRKEEPPLLEKELEKLCGDTDFLRALFILKFDKLKDKLGLAIESSLYYGNYVESLSKFIEKSKVNEIISKLLILGIIDSENLFNLDIEKILLREDNLQKIKEISSFDENELEKEIKVDWGLFIDLKRMLEGYTPLNLEKFIKMGAVLLSKDKILLRSGLRKIYEKVVNYIETKLKEKIGDIYNVTIIPFYAREGIKELEGKIVIILEGNIENEFILERNIILKISPKEIGMETTRETNEEYNAIGEIENLDKVKKAFNTCEWISMEDNYYVKIAKKLIEDKKIPKISFEELIEEVKKDTKLSFMLLIASTKYPSRSGMKYYSEDILWSDTWLNMKKLFPNITREEFEKLKNKLVELVKKARVDIVEFSDRDIVYKKCKEVLINEILKRIRTLDENSKKSLFTFLKLVLMEDEFIYNFSWNVEWGNWKTKFPILYEFLFNEEFKNDLEKLWNLISSVGLGIEATWIHSHGPEKGKKLERGIISYEMAGEIEKILENEIKTVKIDPSIFLEKMKENIIELIGLDFILSKNGFVKKEELRNFLWNISLKAWEEFESFEGIISPKDKEIIAINPLIIKEIQNFIKSKKKEIAEKINKELIEILESSEGFGVDITCNEELEIYIGTIRTKDGEELTLIITPWYLPQYEKFIGKKTLLIIGSQPDYDQFVKLLKEWNEEIILLFIKEKNIFVYSSFENNLLTNSLLRLFIENDYNLEKMESEFEELEKEERGGVEELETPEFRIEGDILDEIFPPLGKKEFSSLFDTTGKPKCIVLVGEGGGKKIIEDLLKEELKYWGFSTPPVKYLEVIRKDEEKKNQNQ